MYPGSFFTRIMVRFIFRGFFSPHGIFSFVGQYFCSYIIWAEELVPRYRNYKAEIQGHRDFHAPCDLDEDTMNALHKVSYRRGNSLRIQALPGHLRHKELPRSTMRSRMAEWLQSSEGKSWQEQRDDLCFGFRVKIDRAVFR